MADTTAPGVLKLSPTPGSVGFGQGSPIAAEFDEPVQPGSGTIVLKTAGSAVVESFDVATSVHVKFSGSTVTVEPSADLNPATGYTIDFAAGAILDLAGNAATQFGGSFTTDDHGHTASTSAPLNVGQTVTGTAETSADRDWYSVSLTAGSTYTFKLAPSGGSTLDPFLKLYGPDSLQIAEDDNGGGGVTAAITFTPESSGTYYLEAGTGGSKTTGRYQLSAATGETAPPFIVKSNPFPNSTTAAATGISVGFSEPVQRGSGFIVLRTAAGAVVETFDAAASNRITLAGSTVTVLPTALLLPNTAYRLDIPAGAVKDVAGNAFAGISNYNFSTDDHDQLLEHATTLAIGSTASGALSTVFDVDMFSVSLTAGRLYTFHVDPASGSSVNPSLAVLDANGTALAFDDNGGGARAALLDFTPSTTGTYYLETRTAGSKTTGNYQIGAVLAPVAIARGTSSTGMAPTADITVNFNQPIARGTGNIVLKDASGAVLETFDAATSPKVNISGNVLTVNPTADLAFGARYTLEFAAGSVADTSGNPYAGSTNYSFTVDDYANAVAGAGTLTTGAAVTGSIETRADKDWFAVTLTANQLYSFTLDPAAGSTLDPVVRLLNATGGVLTADDNSGGGVSAVVSYTPRSSGTYYVQVESSGGNSAGAYTLTAGDLRAPTVTGFAPLNGSGGVSISSNLVLTFSEPVARGTGDIVLKTTSGTVVESFDAASSNRIAISGATVTIDPTADLAYGTGYSIEFPSGAIKDLGGNSYNGSSAYSFTTAFVAVSQLSTSLGTSATPQAAGQITGFLSGAGATQAVVATAGTTSVVTGTGTDGRQLVAVVPPAAASSVDVVHGALQLHADLPASTGLLASGRDLVSPAVANGFLQSVVSAIYPRVTAGSTDETMRNSLTTAIHSQQTALEANRVASTVVRSIDGVNASGNVTLDTTGGGAQNELFLLKLDTLAPTGQAITVRGVENVVLHGAGTTHFDGGTAVRVTTDAATQAITGSSGNDTFVSVGGDDTFTGGDGSDTFGFAAAGHYTITDFNVATDRVAFNFGGINRIADIVPFITSVDQTDAGVTFHFGAAASITLVGVQASQLTGDNVAFHV